MPPDERAPVDPGWHGTDARPVGSPGRSGEPATTPGNRTPRPRTIMVFIDSDAPCGGVDQGTTDTLLKVAVLGVLDAPEATTRPTRMLVDMLRLRSLTWVHVMPVLDR